MARQVTSPDLGRLGEQHARGLHAVGAWLGLDRLPIDLALYCHCSCCALLQPPLLGLRMRHNIQSELGYHIMQEPQTCKGS